MLLNFFLEDLLKHPPAKGWSTTTPASCFEPHIPVKTIPALPTGKAASIVSRDLGIKEKVATTILAIFHWEGKFYLTSRIDFAFNVHPELLQYHVCVLHITELLLDLELVWMVSLRFWYLQKKYLLSWQCATYQHVFVKSFLQIFYTLLRPS
ncbi:hypothetical protein BIY37_12840 [Candidatus Brocadia sapporoensis]|uniref:Uncharacterized protein n=1 Tax=Candidatus Brocadia sapporoensis TaxID=392547 RepID=A0A1V6LWT6_9BACT|nr:hypothetical protein [Candidatus Brocadia sapporoensis]MDG6004259.1 hypothetical protein [Candidatus Brocadia sp.]OQD44594.1 hypothetical protein BIY37_12840 [Candidatus Brocadia sapporoensis]GJQ23349.1 MAG: hypothetical protein HBSAPP01_11390 [Candidatus Brocadia sapporoensis]